MISGFILKKGSMTNIYREDGKRIPVTKCIAHPLKVTQVKTETTDGYQAIQVAVGTKKRLNNSIKARLAKAKLDISPKNFKEFKLITDSLPEVGTDINFDTVFSIGDQVKAIGVSKGKGFAGVIKRHNFQRQPVSGGQSDRVRAPGSIGAQTPGKVLKGKKMPGHMGDKQITVTGLKIIDYNPQTYEVLVSGSVPGSINSWVTLKK